MKPARHHAALAKLASPGWGRDTTTTGAAGYSYDTLGRLVGVSDRPAAGFGGCADRTYAFDTDSNRIGKSQVGVAGSWTLGGMSGTCVAASSATTSAAFDTASRITGATHDDLGRVTSLPGSVSGLSTAVSSTFRVDDLVASVSDGTTTRSCGRDPVGRVRTVTTAGATETWHYGDGSGDSPAWTQAGSGVITRYLSGLDGRLLATTTHSAGGAQTSGSWQVTGLHGDVVTTTPVLSGVQASPAGYVRYDEYGTPVTGTPGRYGWLGGHTRPGGDTTTAGIVLMGVRLYAPTLGRFLSVDPVPGGCSNPYVYVDDPINQYDLDGRSCKRFQAVADTLGLRGFINAVRGVWNTRGNSGAAWRTLAAEVGIYAAVRANAPQGLLEYLRATRSASYSRLRMFARAVGWPVTIAATAASYSCGPMARRLSALRSSFYRGWNDVSHPRFR